MSDPLLERIPPSSIEAEQSTLGAMLLDPEAVEKASEILQPGDFYRQSHGDIFSAMMAIHERRDSVDATSLNDELTKRGKLDGVGGMGYIMSLAEQVPSTKHVETYAKIVEKKAVLRRLIAAGHEIAALGYDGDADVEEATDKAENIIFKIADKRSGKYFSAMPELIRETWEWMDRRAEMKGEASGSPTGFLKLDQMTSGLQPSDLSIIAARPSMGKTALALNLAVNTALSEDKAVAIFSLEMSESQLIQRIICSQARVNAHRMRTGYFRDEEWGKVAEVANRLYNAPIFIDDTTDMTVLNMRAKCRRLKAERGLGLIVVDYLQLMSSHRSTDNRVQEISEIARGLKSLAREMNVPVIALSQLSRAVERRDDKRPMLSDLRESGSIEAEADVVMMLYRDSYYKRKEVVDFKKDEGDEGEEPVTEADNTAEVIIAKHRNGPTGTVKLAFVQEFASFENLEENMKEE